MISRESTSRNIGATEGNELLYSQNQSPDHDPLSGNWPPGSCLLVSSSYQHQQHVTHMNLFDLFALSHFQTQFYFVE